MYKSILLPVDLGESASGQKAQETAIKLAEQNGAELHVITVPHCRITCWVPTRRA
jgi:nucleotide-binding universal stress UspA family protein